VSHCLLLQTENSNCEPHEVGWRIQHGKLYNHFRPFFSSGSSKSTIRWEINKVLREHFLVPTTSAKATSLLGKGSLLIPRTQKFIALLQTPPTRDPVPTPWNGGAPETRYRALLEFGCQKAAFCKLANVDFLCRVLSAMLEEGYWRSKEEQLIKNELQQALLFYKNTKAKHLPKMITAYVRDLHNELSALAEADVSFGDEATAANDDIDCNELEDTTVLQEGSPQDADFVAELEAELDFEDSYDGYSPGGDHGAAHEIESPASCNVVGTVDALCSPKLHGNLLHLCPTMKVQISTLTSQSEHDLCTLQVEGAELYTVFKPRSPAKFASHTFYRSHTTKHVSVAVSPDLQLPKHMVGSEFLVQIVPGVGEGALRVLWVDVLRRKSKSFIGQDAKTRHLPFHSHYLSHPVAPQDRFLFMTGCLVLYGQTSVIPDSQL